LRPFPIYPLYTQAEILSLDKPIADCLLPPEPDTTKDKLLEAIIRQMAEAQGINEDLKARDQMAWVGAMNNIKSAALEIMRER